MKYHPAQSNKKLLDKISGAFWLAMQKKGLIPKDPWKAKKTHEWLAKMGARMHPGSNSMSPWERVDCNNYVNFKVECAPSKRRIKGRREYRFMRIEIPHDLADRILVLGYLP